MCLNNCMIVFSRQVVQANDNNSRNKNQMLILFVPIETSFTHSRDYPDYYRVSIILSIG